MVISGLLVVCATERMAEAREALQAYPWLTIHHTEPNGRMVATLEAADTAESIARLRELQEHPQVVMAELVEYYVGDG